MMQVARIRGFLLQAPKPSTVRVTGEGEPQELKQIRSYAKCAETIVALEPELIECLDRDGNLLRALRADSPEAQSESPPLPAALSNDPAAAMLTHFASLLHRAYEHSTTVAFAKLVELVERMGDRAEAIEQRLERAEAAHREAVQEQIDDAFDRAEEAKEQAETGGGGDLLQNMAGAFLQGKMQGAAAKGGNGKGHA
jgi:hypothetical protein